MPAARIRHGFQQVSQAVQAGLGEQAIRLLAAESREDTLACDTLHERQLLETRFDGYRYLLSREKPLSAIIHKPWYRLRLMAVLLATVTG